MLMLARWKAFQLVTTSETVSETIDRTLLELQTLTNDSTLQSALIEFNTQKALLTNELLVLAGSIDTFEGSPNLYEINKVNPDYFSMHSGDIKLHMQQLLAKKNNLVEKLSSSNGITTEQAEATIKLLDDYIPVQLAQIYKYIIALLSPSNPRRPRLQPILKSILNENTPYKESEKQFSDYQKRTKIWIRVYGEVPEFKALKELILEIQKEIINLTAPITFTSKKWGITSI